jgi:rhamnosyltransferase
MDVTRDEHRHFSADRAARVASVTVTYNPDRQRLAEQVEALRGQVDDILIVDNGSTASIGEVVAAASGARIFPLGDNRGIAHGFNVGIRAARELGADFVLLLDHDSIPTPGMVAALLAAHRPANAAGTRRIAATGPRIRDLRDRHDYPFIRLGWTHNRHMRCAAAELVETDFIISSGALIAMDAVREVGELDESLFIDSVDFEWCCRARSLGYRLLGVCGARLDHWLGDHRRQLMPGMALVIHSPHRLYYMTRNRLLLYTRAYVPLKWKIKDVVRMACKFIVTIVLVAPRRLYARMTWVAIRDGVAGRGGRL